jgi:ankyrin repeat protein
VIKALLAGGAEVGAKDACEETALFKAVANGSMELVLRLLASGHAVQAKLDTRNASRYSMLMVAAQHGRLEVGAA